MGGNELDQEIGGNIRKWRNKRDISLEKLGQECLAILDDRDPPVDKSLRKGYDPNSLSAVERGLTSVDWARLAVIAEALEVKVSVLLPKGWKRTDASLDPDMAAELERIYKLPRAKQVAMAKRIMDLLDAYRD